MGYQHGWVQLLNNALIVLARQDELPSIIRRHLVSGMPILLD